MSKVIKLFHYFFLHQVSVHYLSASLNIQTRKLHLSYIVFILHDNIKFLLVQGISFLEDTALFEVAALLQLHILCTESKTSCKRAANSKSAVSSKKLFPRLPKI